jgi:hypothetical protein
MNIKDIFDKNTDGKNNFWNSGSQKFLMVELSEDLINERINMDYAQIVYLLLNER